MLITDRKKIVLIIAILTSAMCCLSAALENVYLSYQPTMNQNNGIDMGGSLYRQYSADADLTHSNTSGDSKYTDEQMLGVIGLGDIPKSEYGTYSLFKVEIDAYENPNTKTFVFRSESNPMYQRPFELYAVAYTSQQNRYRPSTNARSEKIGVTGHFASKSNNQYIKEWSNVHYLDESGLSPEQGGVYIDLILSLPQPDSLLDSNGYDDNIIIVDNKSYYLAPANDYSAVINITLSFENTVSKEIVKKSVSIPFSGYFKTTGGNEDFCAISISRLPQASNLSIENDSGRWVSLANINLLRRFSKKNGKPYYDKRWEYPFIDDVPADFMCENNSVSFFASSSKDPHTNTGQFQLVNTNVKDGQTLDDRNSIGYTIRIQSDSGVWDFTGEQTTQANMMPEYSFDGGTEDKAVGIKGVYEEYISTADEYEHYHQFIGDMLIMIDEPSTMMSAGAYSSTVYLHIFTNEDSN